MNFLPEPDPVVLAFFAYRRFVFLELLAILSLLRLILGPGLARWPALIALALSLGGILTTFAPALGLHSHPYYVQAAQLMAEGGGMAALLVPAAMFTISAISPRARWRWMDIVFTLMMLVLLGLWWWTS